MLSQNDNIVVAKAYEATPGEVSAGPWQRVYGTAIDYSEGGSDHESGMNTGRGYRSDVQQGNRFGDVTCPTELVYGVNDSEIEDFMRSTLSADLKVEDVSVDFEPAGTQLDGSTGPIIRATTPGEFATFNDEGDLVIQAVLEVTGAANEANNRPRPIKDLDADQIDLDPQYVGGAVGEFGEPLISETAVTVTLRTGLVLKDMALINPPAVSSWEFWYADQPNSYRVLAGQHAVTYKESFSGPEKITLEVGYNGMKLLDLSESATAGAISPNTAIDNPNMIADDSLQWLTIGITPIAGKVLQAFEVSGDGSADPADDVAGAKNRVAVSLGDIMFEGKVDFYHDRVRSHVVDAYARNNQPVPVRWVYQDRLGNKTWRSLPYCTFSAGGVTAGQKGNRSSGALPYKVAGRERSRQFIIQHFPA